MLVAVEYGGAFARFQFDRDDLVLEIAFFDGVDRPPVALDGEFVLLFARNLPLFRDILGGDAHVHGFERIGQRAHHHVDDTAVVHALAPAQGWYDISAAAHRFRATAQCNFRVAKLDRL